MSWLMLIGVAPLIASLPIFGVMVKGSRGLEEATLAMQENTHAREEATLVMNVASEKIGVYNHE